MNAYDEMLVNLKSLKRCRRLVNIISIIYIIMCGLYASMSLIWAFIGDCDSFLFMLIDGLVVKGSLLYCGYRSCYTHSSSHALAALLIQGLSVLVTQTVSLGLFDKVDGAVLVISLVCTLLLLLINPKYLYLEEQPGYPYFNEMMEEEKFNRQQQKIMNEFQQRYEERLKFSSSDMDELEEPDLSDDDFSIDDEFFQEV